MAEDNLLGKYVLRICASYERRNGRQALAARLSFPVGNKVDAFPTMHLPQKKGPRIPRSHYFLKFAPNRFPVVLDEMSFLIVHCLFAGFPQFLQLRRHSHCFPPQQCLSKPYYIVLPEQRSPFGLVECILGKFLIRESQSTDWATYNTCLRAVGDGGDRHENSRLP